MSQANISRIHGLAVGSLEVLRRLGRDKYAKNGSEGFRTLYERLKRLHLSAHSQDKADDIFSSAWSLVFLEKGSTNFRPFNGKIPGTDVNISIENYTAFLLRNAIINESRKQSRSYTSSQDLSQRDEDSDYVGDGMDSIHISSSGSAVIERKRPMRVFKEDDEYRDALMGYIFDCRTQIERINNGECEVKDSKKAIKQIEARIEKLNKELNNEESSSLGSRVDVGDFNNAQYSMEEETSFRTLLELFVNSLGDKDDLRVALFGMLGGLSIDEASKFLETKPKLLFNELRDAFVSFAQDLEFEYCDSVLMDILRGIGSDCRKINRSKGKDVEISKSMRACIKEFSKNTMEANRLLTLYFGDDIL